jgi:transposase
MGGKKDDVAALPVLRPNVAGIDIGSTMHWVCGPAQADGIPNVKTFGTTTPDLNALADWLTGQGVESVAMESTYVYWIPLHEILEARGIEVVLVNARHFRYVPGRKTDMKDCQWIQLLHSCGLLKGSFRPAEEICALRALQRQMDNLVEERTRCVQWMQKSLDQMNVQVHRAVTDLTGKTGMAIVRAIVAGERDPSKLAAYRDQRCKKTISEIAKHLYGNWRDEHLYNLGSALRLYDAVEAEIAVYDAELLAKLEAIQPPERNDDEPPPNPNTSKEKAMRRRGEQKKRTTLYRVAGVDLIQVDGIGIGGATTILTEIGPDLTAFAHEKSFVGWLRLAPRTPISGGKPIRKRRNGLGANRIASVLRMAAVSVQRTHTAIGAYFRRISRRKGAAVAVFATARKIATYVYRLLRYGAPYVDIGAAAYEAAYKQRRLSSLQQMANELGFNLLPQEQSEHLVSG